MDRINGAGHVDHRFVTEDAATNRPPTEITAEWLNGVQEEVVQVIEDSGQVPDGANESQLLAGLKMIFRRMIGAVGVNEGTDNAIAATYAPAVSVLTDGLELEVRCPATNTNAAVTFTPAAGTIAEASVVKGNDVALVIGDIPLRAKFKWDAILGKWVLLNPVTGVVAQQVVTVANDPTFADDSTKAASTGWLRAAMGTIATAAGFVASLTPNGYIKFPWWFGSLIIQWGGGNTAGAPGSAQTFPIAFPSAVWAVAGAYGTGGSGTNVQSLAIQSITTTGFSACGMNTAGSAYVQPFKYIAIGK